MTTTAYRDPLERARLRLAELTEAFFDAAPGVSLKRRILARRAGRVAFGAVGVAGMLLVTAGAVYNWLYTSARWDAPTPPDKLPLTEMLLGTWGLAAVAWVVVRAVGSLLTSWRDEPPPSTGQILADLARLEHARAARLDGRRLLAWSLALPAAAICLLLPLTLHFLFWTVAMRNGAELRGFDDWISISLAIVGHAHLVVAGFAVANARRIARLPVEAAALDGQRGFSALGWTVLTGALPGIVFFAVPPVLVAVTGVAFIPLLWSAMRRVSVAERRALVAVGVEFV